MGRGRQVVAGGRDGARGDRARQADAGQLLLVGEALQEPAGGHGHAHHRRGNQADVHAGQESAETQAAHRSLL